MKLSTCVLTFGFISVAIGSSNIASEGTATQVDTYGSSPAWLAIDGITDGNFKEHPGTHTISRGKNAWWRLTFRSEYIIEEIRIWNRLDCCTLRLKGVTVWVGDKQVGRIESGDHFHRFPNINAIAAEITIKGFDEKDGYLSFAEVEVFGESYPWKNIANKGKAVQAGNLETIRGIAELAIDGNTNGMFAYRSVTHTKSKGSSAWWLLKFDNVRYIKFLIIYNRMDDCCTHWLDGVTINVNMKQVGEVCFKPGQVSYIFDIDEWSSEIKIIGGISSGHITLAEVKVFGHKI